MFHELLRSSYGAGIEILGILIRRDSEFLKSDFLGSLLLGLSRSGVLLVGHKIESSGLVELVPLGEEEGILSAGLFKKLEIVVTAFNLVVLLKVVVHCALYSHYVIA